jgi:glucose/arabinose dehydrogenase
MKSLTTSILFVLICLKISYSQDIELELFASNLDRPVNIKHAGDDRLFVAEQDGLIKIINADGTIQNTPFLDINSRVINTGNERGLLGLAFHPNYSVNGYFFVNYINNSGNTVVSRFTMDFPNTEVADPNSEFIILTFSQPFSNHNGGDLAFGQDGFLYISSGDGGSGGDPQNNSQNINNLLGKILRVNVDATTASQNYSIPSDNPFVGNPAARGEIWAYGLRNPWKFSFDRINGDLWIGDVGQGDYEEINRAPSSAAGVNYGWRCYEANSPYDTADCSDPASYTFPISEYDHSGSKCSITGGYRYSGTTYPGFEGWYFFADFCSAEIGSLVFDNNNNEWNMTLLQFTGNWSAFGEAIDGEIYISDLTSGSIYKLTDAALSVEDYSLNTISIYPNPANHEVNIDFSSNNSVISPEISIYDMQGKIVKTITRNTKTIQKINTSELSNGLYFLKINTVNGEQSSHKLFIN